MATRQIRIDDLDGKTEGAETVFFSLQDEFYRLDLAEVNLKKLTELLAPYMDKASRSDAPRGGKRSPASAFSQGFGEIDPMVVREWAKNNNIPISDKGRVPEDIVNRWKAAQQTS